jgi:serine/threonine-protein kinase
VIPRQSALQAGTILHETYEIVRMVGAGGMGQVYEARHARLPGRFAIKILAGANNENAAVEFVRFRREAEIASSLRHPHIVQVVDFNQMEDSTPYFVMEYLDGVDLATELDRAGPFPPGRAAVIVDQIADAVAAAHARGIIHRDLKPQNVLFVSIPPKERDFVKVVDFGISKVRTAATLTDGSRLLGTPQYMSPEQARGEPDEIDGSTDQFALAAMAYEMLCGRPAFSADNVPAILFRVSNEPPASLGELTGADSRALEVVLWRALAKDKASRYASILEFSEAFTAAVAGQKPRRPATTVGRQSPRPAPTRRWGRIAIGAGVVIAALGAAAVLRPRLSPGARLAPRAEVPAVPPAVRPPAPRAAPPSQIEESPRPVAQPARKPRPRREPRDAGVKSEPARPEQKRSGVFIEEL